MMRISAIDFGVYNTSIENNNEEQRHFTKILSAITKV
jgi:hypothetical protein